MDIRNSQHHSHPTTDRLPPRPFLISYLTSFPLVEFLADAGDDSETCVESVLDFLSNQSIRFAENVATFRMAQDYVARTNVIQHRRGDVA